MLLGSVGYSQGWMFFSIEEIKTELIESKSSYTITEGDLDNGMHYAELDSPDFGWIVFFDMDVDLVYESHFSVKSYDAFLFALQSLNQPNNGMLRQGEGHWIHMMGSGAIDVRTHKRSYSDYPIFIYTYKTY